MAARIGSSLLLSSRYFSAKSSVINFISHHSCILKLPLQCASARAALSTSSSVFAEQKFSKKHEWVTLNGKIGTVGISHYAQELLGDVVYVQLPEVGAEFSAEDECGAVESVKAASEIYTPVSGKVTEINANLEENPGLVNQSCYDKGWLFRLELSKPEEYDSLLSDKQYEQYLKTLE